MRERLMEFAAGYDTEVDRLAAEDDELRGIHHPLIFLFVGDGVQEALEAVHGLNARKWHNSSGVLYFHLHTGKTVERDNIYSLRLGTPGSGRKTLRNETYRKFYQEEETLTGLNRVLRQIKTRISDFGRTYASFERLNLAVVTRIDDPLNILLPEITLLARAVFGESFKSIQTDLYAINRERTSGEDFGFTASLATAFLHEMDAFQNRNYQFSGLLQVTEDGIRMPVGHSASPLFDLVYLLGDKNERGIFDEPGMDSVYEILCSLNLLKNRRSPHDYEREHDSYNNQQFRKNIQLSDASESVYASAGFAKVKRPNRAIGLTVLSLVYQEMLKALGEAADEDHREVLERMELDEPSLDRLVQGMMPGRDRLEEMNGLLCRNVSFGSLKQLTVGEAERELYGEHAELFFRRHFKEASASRMDEGRLKRGLEDRIQERLVEDSRFGLFRVIQWTGEGPEWSAAEEIRTMLHETAARLESARFELGEVREVRVEELKLGGFSLFNGNGVKRLSRHLFGPVYDLVYDILFLETKEKLLRLYSRILDELHGMLEQQARTLRETGRLLRETAMESVSEAKDRLERNIPDYYGPVVRERLRELASKRGPRFYFENEGVGPMAKLLREGQEALLERLIAFCRKEIFPAPAFRQRFEDELLERSNVTVSFDSPDVLSREELFRDLYDSLMDRAAVRIQTTYSHKHRYEEHYFFGDYGSEFLQYALQVDQASRTYKAGCVHEKKSSGVEKLTLMGGFRLADLTVYQNGLKYYESYRKEGYRFHAGDEEESGLEERER